MFSGGAAYRSRIDFGLTLSDIILVAFDEFPLGLTRQADFRCVFMPKARILLIEDEPTSREILQYVLSEAGYPVDVSATAAAAHRQLDVISYGLVIADWQLPDGDGIYIADRAFALGAWTVIITGHFSDLPPGTARCHRLLMKPVRPAELLAIVRALIGEPPDSP